MNCERTLLILTPPTGTFPFYHLIKGHSVVCNFDLSVYGHTALRDIKSKYHITNDKEEFVPVVNKFIAQKGPETLIAASW